MDETTNNTGNMKVWTVREILDNYRTLGIPHFQRGLVWNDDNIALLLESLYFDTPCGNIILWEPETEIGEDEKPGISLADKSEPTYYYIVDGQQRIRSLFKINAEIDSGSGDDGTSDEVPYVWAVNLAEFAKILEEETGQSFRALFPDGNVDSLFVRVKDPVRQKLSYIRYARDKLERADQNKKLSQLSPEYRNQYNFVPISIIMKEDFGPEKIIILKKDKAVSEIYNAKDEKALEGIKLFQKETETEKHDISEVKSTLSCMKCTLPSKKRILLEKLKTDVENKESGYKTIFVDLATGQSVDKLKDFLNLLHDNLMKIFSRKFPVRILKTDNMSDIIHTYIRINSGGRSVQQEEKAIARLVQLCPESVGQTTGTFSSIKDLFDSIHGTENDGINDHFRREKEAQFGFKLFVRVFILAANYHTGRAIGTQIMNFTAIENNDELETMAGKTQISKIWEVVKNVTVAVKDLLEKELRFDTLAFLPDSRSLWPVFMILIKHPDFIDDGKVKEEYRNHFAYILLTLLLKVGDSQETIIGLMKDIREFPEDGRSLLCRMVKAGKICEKQKDKKKDRWESVIASVQKDPLKTKLENANSLTNRYTLLLYALERHRNAVDFYGKSLPDPIRGKDEFRTGKPIEKGIFPEKQHIVPYSALNSDRDDDLSKGRKSNDLANNIGNITYISQKLNSYKDGLGSAWLLLNKEQSELNKGHIIFDKAIDNFGKINRDNPSTDDYGAYKEWIGQRQSDIAEEFRQWLTDLQQNASKDVPNFKKLIPHARMLVPPPPEKDGKRLFTGLSYLSEVWNSPETEIPAGKKLEFARDFAKSKRVLKVSSGNDYMIYDDKKKIWPEDDSVKQGSNEDTSVQAEEVKGD